MSTTAFLNLLLQGSDINTLSLHSGAPGVSGTDNEVSGSGYTRQSCTFASAASGEKALSAAVDFSTPANQSVTYLGFWTGSTFRGSQARTSGDATASAGGQYRVTTGTKLILSDVVSFSPQSTLFNGTSSKIESTSLTYTGTAEGTIAFWVYSDVATWGTGTPFMVILRQGGGTICLQVHATSTGRMTFYLNDGGFNTVSANNTFTSQRWHHVIWSYKAGAGGWNQICVDGSGTLQTGVSLTSATLNIAGAMGRACFGSESSSGFLNGSLAYFYANLSTALDLTVQSNREKFILAGAPVNLGANGELPTGSSPHFYLDGGASMTNLGTAGSLTATALAAGGTPALP